MGAHCFFPIVSLPGIVLTTDSQLPAHQLTLFTALGRPCSKFEVESRARSTAFEECNGSPSKGRTIKKKNRRERRKWARRVRWEQDKGRGQQTRGTRVNEIVRIANTLRRRRGLCHERDTLPSHLLPVQFVYFRGKTNKFVFTPRENIIRIDANADVNARPIRRGVVPYSQLTLTWRGSEIFWLCGDKAFKPDGIVKKKVLHGTLNINVRITYYKLLSVIHN